MLALYPQKAIVRESEKIDSRFRGTDGLSGLLTILVVTIAMNADFRFRDRR